MENINTELFLQEWDKIEVKLQEIDNLPRLGGTGRELTGYEIDSTYITMKSSTWFSGCGDETYELIVRWDEINEPIEYFQAKFQKEFDDEDRKKQQRAIAAQKETEARERKQLEELSKKYRA